EHGLAVELHHDAQHAVGRRVLRTHVEDHRVVDVGPGPAGEHELLRTRLTGGRSELLVTLVGLRLEATLLHVGRARRGRGYPVRGRSLLRRALSLRSFAACCVAHRGLGSPLKVTGTRAGASSLRSAWPTQ